MSRLVWPSRCKIGRLHPVVGGVPFGFLRRWTVRVLAPLTAVILSAPSGVWAQAATAAAADPAPAGITLQGSPGAGRQAPARGGALAGRPSVAAVRAAQPPSVDGRLDD